MVERTRKSKQRDRIMEVLRETKSHPTVKWVFNQVRRQFPNLSLGTVYRNLGILVKQGLVRRLDFGSSHDKFEAAVLPHHHFVCKSCGRVSDLDLPIGRSLTKKLQKQIGLAITRLEIRLYGVCEKCSQKG